MDWFGGKRAAGTEVARDQANTRRELALVEPVQKTELGGPELEPEPTFMDYIRERAAALKPSMAIRSFDSGRLMTQTDWLICPKTAGKKPAR